MQHWPCGWFGPDHALGCIGRRRRRCRGHDAMPTTAAAIHCHASEAAALAHAIAVPRPCIRGCGSRPHHSRRPFHMPIAASTIPTRALYRTQAVRASASTTMGDVVAPPGRCIRACREDTHIATLRMVLCTPSAHGAHTYLQSAQELEREVKGGVGGVVTRSCSWESDPRPLSKSAHIHLWTAQELTWEVGWGSGRSGFTLFSVGTHFSCPFPFALYPHSCSLSHFHSDCSSLLHPHSHSRSCAHGCSLIAFR